MRQLLGSKVFSDDEREEWINHWHEFKPDLTPFLSMLSDIRNDRKKTTHAHLYPAKATPPNARSPTATPVAHPGRV